jgi:transposase-like protein
MKAKYTKEFREMAVELSYNTDKPISVLCKELNIGNSALYKWRNEMNRDKKEIIEESSEIKELRSRLAKAEVENQILKKALAICNRI